MTESSPEACKHAAVDFARVAQRPSMQPDCDRDEHQRKQSRKDQLRRMLIGNDQPQRRSSDQ